MFYQLTIHVKSKFSLQKNNVFSLFLQEHFSS